MGYIISLKLIRRLLLIKRCYRCGLEKDEFEFSKDKSRHDGLSNKCRECSNAINKLWREKHHKHLASYKKDWRNNNPELHNTFAKTAKENRKRKVDVYRTKCVKCGESRYYVIDFHHINNADKSFGINLAKQNGYSIEQIESELKKCVCLCRNCHSEFHHIYGNVPTKPVDALQEYIGCDPYSVTAN